MKGALVRQKSWIEEYLYRNPTMNLLIFKINQINYFRSTSCSALRRGFSLKKTTSLTPTRNLSISRPSVDRLIFDSLSLTTKEQKIINAAEKALNNTSWNVCDYGFGPLKYDGKRSTDEGVFIGRNAALESFIINFSGKEGERHLKMLVSTLDLAQLNKFSVTRINYSSGLDASIDFETEEQFGTAAQQVVLSQQESKPVVMFKKKTLSIGNSSSSQYVKISPLLSSSVGKISGIQVNISIKNNPADALWATLISAEVFDLTNLLAFFLLESLSKVVSTKLIEFIRSNLRSGYDLGSIVILRKNDLTVSPSIRYVKSALKAVEKRLNEQSISLDAQAEIVSFLDTILNSPSEIVKLAQFRQKILETVNNTKVTAIEAASKTKAP